MGKHPRRHWCALIGSGKSAKAWMSSWCLQVSLLSWAPFPMVRALAPLAYLSTLVLWSSGSSAEPLLRPLRSTLRFWWFGEFGAQHLRSGVPRAVAALRSAPLRLSGAPILPRSCCHGCQMPRKPSKCIRTCVDTPLAYQR
jgi:hypothetical protein